MSIAGAITRYLNIILGTLFILVIGFFVMQIILAAINLATGFSGSTKTYEDAIKQLTGAIKGLLLAFVTFFLLNTILFVLNINTPTENITEILGNQLQSLFVCLRDFRGCTDVTTRVSPPQTPGPGPRVN